ncbi:hypothetical protein NBRC111894_2810 [Sporolactobacillus inulinus]|uniref:Uncharacterized protein n=1 Tax=Sporolactobacillus inulinus TaxID=2078 RepID=A0A4Y1ZDR0_9BACL|nr:hypothetical protein NBRC111894_2810 [Sporolactobacillus inulinus]
MYPDHCSGFHATIIFDNILLFYTRIAFTIHTFFTFFCAF